MLESSVLRNELALFIEGVVLFYRCSKEQTTATVAPSYIQFRGDIKFLTRGDDTVMCASEVYQFKCTCRVLMSHSNISIQY